MQINLGVLVELKAKNSTRFRFQNYTIGGDVTYEGLTWTLHRSALQVWCQI